MMGETKSEKANLTPSTAPEESIDEEFGPGLPWYEDLLEPLRLAPDLPQQRCAAEFYQHALGTGGNQAAACPDQQAA